MKKYFLLIIFTFGIFISYSQKLDSIKYSNGNLFYHEYGKGETIIILSGGPGISCEQEQEVAVELGKKYRAILLEQRGTGRSIPIPFDSMTINLKSAHEDLNLLLKHLKIENAIFYGHSWGGMLALSYAENFPQKVKGLILVGVGFLQLNSENIKTAENNIEGRYGKYELERLSKLEKKERLTKQDSIEKRKLNNYAYIDASQKIDSIFPRIIKGKINYKMKVLMLKDLSKNKFDLLQNLKKLETPIFAICGKQDPFLYNTYELKIAKPTTNMYLIQSCGHYPMFEQKSEFYNRLELIMHEIENFR